MESSSTVLRLGNLRALSSRRSRDRGLGILLRHPTINGTSRLLSILLLPLPTILHLRVLRVFLDCPMAVLPMERGLGVWRMGLQTKILALRRRVLLHPPREIRTWRDHQRTIRTDDARPTTTQHRPAIQLAQ